VYKVTVPGLQTGVQQELSDPSTARQASAQASTLPYSKPVRPM
jgi:hypothetical protein